MPLHTPHWNLQVAVPILGKSILGLVSLVWQSQSGKYDASIYFFFPQRQCLPQTNHPSALEFQVLAWPLCGTSLISVLTSHIPRTPLSCRPPCYFSHQILSAPFSFTDRELVREIYGLNKGNLVMDTYATMFPQYSLESLQHFVLNALHVVYRTADSVNNALSRMYHCH